MVPKRGGSGAPKKTPSVSLERKDECSVEKKAFAVVGFVVGSDFGEKARTTIEHDVRQKMVRLANVTFVPRTEMTEAVYAAAIVAVERYDGAAHIAQVDDFRTNILKKSRTTVSIGEMNAYVGMIRDLSLILDEDDLQPSDGWFVASDSKKERKEKEPTKRRSEMTPGFEIRRELGRGTFGVVYEAVDVRSGSAASMKSTVAIKVLTLVEHAKTGIDQEQLIELTSQRALSGHPNVASILEVVRTGTHLIIVMTLARTNLWDALISEPLSLDTGAKTQSAEFERRLQQRMKWAREILCGILFLHSQGFLHRDLKPPNVLIGHDGVAQIADFGLVRRYDAAVPSSYGRAPDYVGTLDYDAPELLCRNYHYNETIDFWAFGWILVQLLFDAIPILRLKSRTPETICGFIHDHIGWPAEFQAYMLRTAFIESPRPRLLPPHVTSEYEPEEVKQKRTETLIFKFLNLPATPQLVDKRLVRGLLPSLKTVNAFARAHGVDNWPNVLKAFDGLLQVDPRERTTDGATLLFSSGGGETCPLHRSQTGASPSTAFREYADYVTQAATLSLATRIWNNLDLNTPRDAVHKTGDSMQKRLWRLAALALAAKDLEDDIPQLDPRVSATERAQINRLERTILDLIHENVFTNGRVMKKAPVPLPSSSASSSSSSLSPLPSAFPPHTTPSLPPRSTSTSSKKKPASTTVRRTSPRLAP
jgi:serine/threonine protein kinase